MPQPITTIAAALDLVVSTHRARLSDAALGTAESIARQAGATPAQIFDAVRQGRTQ